MTRNGGFALILVALLAMGGCGETQHTGVAVTFSAKSDDQLPLLENAVNAFLNQCTSLSGEGWQDVTAASIKIGDALYYQVERGWEKEISMEVDISGEHCTYIMDEKLTELGALKDVCMRLCDIPETRDGSNGYVPI